MGGAVMAHPTDDELEAMAVDLVFFHPGETSELAAAMLRACKGRDVKRICDYCDETDPEIQAACFAKQCGIALKPAPDHDTWNAALEVAAKEIDCGCDGACMWPHACPKEDIEAIRNLKKGQTND